MWDLPGPGIEPVPPALAGRFLTTAPPGTPQGFSTMLLILFYSCDRVYKGESTKGQITALPPVTGTPGSEGHIAKRYISEVGR